MSSRYAIGILATLLFTAQAVWSCIIIPPPPPRPEIKPLHLEVASQHVEARIENQVVVTSVTTILRNPHARQVEGTFVFPLPPGASASGFSYWMDGKEVPGELLDSDKARRYYQEIVQKLRDPALLEYQEGQLFRARIFPIEAHGTAKTRLEYTQVLRADDNVVRYRHAVRLGRTRPNQGELVIKVEGKSEAAVKSVYSPTHDLDVLRPDDHHFSASCEIAKTDFERDFELIYTLSEDDFGLNVLTHREAGAAGYFMVLLSPRHEWAEKEIEGKDVIMVLDTSGSMRGEKMEQARAAYAWCLKALRPDDRFGVLAFATGVRVFEETLLPANEANVSRALRFVESLNAAGATALDEALTQAVSMVDAAGDRPSLILFLTDGLPTVGERNPERILTNVRRLNRGENEAEETAQRLGRLFLFGVGDDVNTHLLDRLADENGGATVYVRPEEDIEMAVSSLYTKLSHPVLADVELAVEGAGVYDRYPVKLPDLFVGSQLVVLGRYDKSGSAEVTLAGHGAGEKRRFIYEAEFASENLENTFLPRTWAIRRIGFLLDQIRLHGEDKEVKEEIIRLAKRYGIVTAYTSYLVREDEVAAPTAVRPAVRDVFNLGAPGMPAGPAEPASEALRRESGAGAVHAAQSISAMKTQSRAADDTALVRHVGTWTFYQVDDVWEDSTWQDDLTMLRVRAFSPAYFALLDVRPDLAAVFALGDHIRVRVGEIGLFISPDGVETLTETQLEGFRQ